MPQLNDLVLDLSTTIAAIAEHLDGLEESACIAALDALGRHEQRALYDKAAAAAPLTLAHFVPDTAAPLEAVNHQGRNTLPLPGKHRRFHKCFCRPRGSNDRLFGYNEAPSRGLIGPGYFVAVATAGQPDWEARGAIVVDYFQVPDAEVCAGWPAVVPNTKGLQRFVYRGTRDFMRRVSQQVSIGAAYKGEKALDHYFTLYRRQG